MSASPESLLAIRLRSGDESAFRELAESYYEPLARFAYTFVKSSDTAQDIIQDVFANLWHRRDTVRIERGLKSYLFSAVRNASLNVQRRQHTERRYEQSVKATDSVTEDKSIEDSDAFDVSNILQSLTPRQAEAIHLRYQQDLTFREIAETMGVTVNAVEQLVQRAIKILRDKLAPE